MWKQIYDYPNYEVSDKGEIRNIKSGRILKTRPNPRGYYYTNLSKNGNLKVFRIHRIVAQLFIPNPDGKSEVNHIDGNKKNNAADNLEWVTREENRQHAIDTGLMSGGIPVDQYEMTGEFVARYESLSKAAFSVNGDSQAISHCCKGWQSHHRGFVWKYALLQDTNSL